MPAAFGKVLLRRQIEKAGGASPGSSQLGRDRDSPSRVRVTCALRLRRSARPEGWIPVGHSFKFTHALQFRVREITLAVCSNLATE